MKRTEAIAKLRDEGFAATVGRLRQAVMNGHLRPFPRKVAGGAYNFTPRHLTQLRRYMINTRPGPQPLFAEKFPIRAPHDRLHRLMRKKQRLGDKRPLERTLRERRKEDADATIQILERIARELDSEHFEGALPAPRSGAEQ